MEKVLLINPPSNFNSKYIREGRCNQRSEAFSYFLPPLSLLSIGSLLRRNNIKVKIIDFEAKKRKIKKFIKIAKKFNPELIISSVAIETIYSDLKFLEMMKRITNAFVGVMGVFPTVEYEWILKNYNIDFVIRNEPEITALEISKIKKENFFKEIKEIKGVAFKINNKIFKNPEREFYHDINYFKVDSYDLIDVKDYNLPFSNRPVGLVSPERGCPFNCIFCVASIYYGKKPRYKKVNVVIDEINHLVYENKVKDIGFWSEVLTLNKKFTIEIFKSIIKEKIDANFYLTTRVDNVNKEILKIMKKANVITVAFGIESASQKILDTAKKGITVKQIKDAIKNIKLYNMNALGHVIFGLPGETLSSMKTTLNFVLKNKVDFTNFYIAVPYPGTEFFELAKSKGWIKTFDWSKYGLQNAVISYPHLPDHILEKFRKHAFLKFYSSPQKILSVIKAINIRDCLPFFKEIVRVYSNWISP